MRLQTASVVGVAACCMFCGLAQAQTVILDTVPGAFIDIAQPGNLLPGGPLGDDEERVVVLSGPLAGVTNSELGLTGNGTDRIVVGNNGAIGFPGGAGSLPSNELAAENQPFPSNAAYGGGRTAGTFWDDIGNTTGDVYAAVQGGSGGSTLIIQWNKPYTGETDTVSFQMQIFDEGTPGFPTPFAQYLYADIEQPRAGGGGSATIGFQNGADTINYSFNIPGAVTDPDGPRSVLTLVVRPGAPRANAGGPYFVDCDSTSERISIRLDGRGSSDPNDDPLTYLWTSNCPNFQFDNPNSPTPLLTIDRLDPCNRSCWVRLTVADRLNPPVSAFALITCQPSRVTTVSQKGSLLVYPKVEVKWDSQGNVIQDTFISLLNDYHEGVSVQMYFVNGDEPDLPDHPGWNWVDNQIFLTQNQPVYWAASSGQTNPPSNFSVSPWSVLDPGNPPGRPDPDNPDISFIRGYIVLWAVDAQGREIRFNHLSGNAMIVNYVEWYAWDYLPWAYQSRCGEHGVQPRDCIARDANNHCFASRVIPGRLDTDGFQYDFNPSQLLMTFFAAGATLFSDPRLPDGNQVLVDTDLTLMPASSDLRQDNDGPPMTKARFDIWNGNEVRFSEVTRCISCWDQELLSRYGNPQHFLRENLHTNQGKARIDGERSTQCPDSRDHALLGVAARVFTFNLGTDPEWSASNLIGLDTEAGRILYDVVAPGGPANRPKNGRELVPINFK